MNFTDQIAEYIAEKNLDLRNLTIVLPSERAKKYIAASLYRKAGKALLAPEMITMDRWVKKFAPAVVIDKTRLLLHLYEVQLQNTVTEKDRNFDEFLSWGPIVLSDFDEIDRYCLDATAVFKNLRDIKALESWNFDDEEKIGEGQHRFMNFWNHLGGYYTVLDERLKAKQVTNMGKAYRHLSENIQVLFVDNKERHFLFAGFNALSKAEISIIKQLRNMGRGHVLIDSDAFYLNKLNHEAGTFQRQLLKELDLKKMDFIGDRLTKESKSIKIIECAQHTGQAKIIATLLEGMSQEELKHSVLLLADEKLINPILKNLPKSIEKANVTLGLPLVNSAMRTWVDLLFRFQEHKLSFKTEALYIQDLQKFWNHPFVIQCSTQQEKEAIVSQQKILIAKNSIFVNPSNVKIGPLCDQLLQLACTNWEGDWNIALQQIRNSNALIYENLKETDAFEKAIVMTFDEALVDFQNLCLEGLPQMSLRSFKHLFQQHWTNKSIAFHGNPLDGLQIMGLLETRLLNFEKVFIVGMNEGKLPPTNPIQTTIPMDLRSYLQIPTPREKQGLFAHHFYRLLHTAKEVVITYTTAQENIGSSEPSRYLAQLELELSRVNEQLNIDYQYYSIPEENGKLEDDHQLEKNDEVMELIEQYLKKDLSASAINKFLNCSLDFYYRYLLEFYEEDEIKEEVEHSSFGTFIHNVLETLYRPFARHDKQGEKISPSPKNITSFDVEQMLKMYEYELKKEFSAHFNQDASAFSTGKNLLSYKMASELLRNVLKSEIEFLKKQQEPVFIEYLEVALKAPLSVEVNGETKQLTFKGIIDRIDSIGDKVRIIDYKSGKTELKDVEIKKGRDADYLKSVKSTKHALQLMLYCFLYEKNFKHLPSEVAIFSITSSENRILPLQSPELSLQEILALFPELLGEICTELLDPELPFTHDSDKSKYCNFCG